MSGNNSQVGILHEVGDLGLGFDPLSTKDLQTLNENYYNDKNQSGNDDRDKEGR